MNNIKKIKTVITKVANIPKLDRKIYPHKHVLAVYDADTGELLRYQSMEYGWFLWGY
jgi:hypothetical protein